MEDEIETVTPGPWSIIADGGAYVIHNLEIDEIVVWEMGGIDNKANAALIAAAPDLLAACEAFIKRNYAPIGTNPLQLAADAAIVEKLVKAAIVKAKGEVA